MSSDEDVFYDAPLASPPVTRWTDVEGSETVLGSTVGGVSAEQEAENDCLGGEDTILLGE